MSRDALTENPDDYCFFDVETRSPEDVTLVGAYRHNTAGMVVIFTYAIGETGEIKDWVVPDFETRLNWHDMPQDLHDFWYRARHGEAWFVAWNAAFDRLAANRGMDVYGNTGVREVLTVEMTIDAMAQAVRSHLPPDLLGAGASIGAKVQKDKDGKRLIKLFSDPEGGGTPQSHPEDWEKFRQYARDDVGTMREIFFGTLPLSRAEWEEYWASERINDRGLPIDTEFVRAASDLAEYNAKRVKADVQRISDNELYSVNQHEKMTQWVLDRIGHLSRVEKILTKERIEGEPDADGNDTHEVKLSLERSRVEELILFLEKRDEELGLTDDEADALDMLDVRVFGASATPRKFTKMLRQVEDGRLKGSYVFNGAAATGRFSSRGVQTHNLTRSTVAKTPDDEAEVIDTIIDLNTEDAYDKLTVDHGPVGRTLSRLIRPSITAPEGYELVWGDWSAIEARVLPWLAKSEKAERVLDTFRTNDANPELPDIYKVTASDILKVIGQPVEAADISGYQRQGYGKVPTLSLGFGGAEGALFAMATTYGIVFSDEEARTIVEAWRETNPWARRFWDTLWYTALEAMDRPMTSLQAGRVEFLYVPEYLQGTLFMFLPCGRPLLYPRIRWERREIKDKNTGKVSKRDQLTYRRGYGRAALWYGTLAENATQGFAGSLMRRLLREIEGMAQESRPPLLLPVGHTHDEALGMAEIDAVPEAREFLQERMLHVPGYAEGLPLAAGVDSHYCYTKTLD